MSMQITHPQNVFKKREKVNMSDDLVKRLRELNTFEWHAKPATTKETCFAAADRIEDLTKSNTNLRIIAMTNSARIVSLENSFRTILDHAEQWVIQEIARKALEGKDD